MSNEAPRQNRRERQVQERRNDILSAALRLFETKGYLETSMEEIAETADVARGTLYNHFDSKAEVLLAMTDSVAAQWLEAGHREFARSDSGTAAIKETLAAAAEWFDKHPDSAKAFYYAMRELISRQDKLAPPRSLVPREFVVAAQEKGELTGDLAPDLLVLLIDTLLRFHLTTLLSGNHRGKFAAEIRREAGAFMSKLAP